MKPEEFTEELNGYVTAVDKALDGYLAVKENPQKTIYEAMRYSVFAGGKRLRPVLALSSAKMCGGKTAEVMPFACAMELIHTYSLIHDDLPAMDNDDLRRGRATSHIKFGEAAAILAGDALLNKAFEIMSSEDADNTVEIMRVIAKSSGTEGMIGGQVTDIESEGRAVGLDELKYIHSLKTGAIIRSACAAGALSANAGANELSAIDEFAKNLGIAFQIRDDILDVTGDAAELGKTIGSDIEQDKNTYASLLGIEKSEELVVKYSNAAKDALAMFGEKADFLCALTDYLVNRRK